MKDELGLQVDDLTVSWAQHGEDIVLGRVFFQQPTGFWVDVGANDPQIDSVTHAFSARGWRGVNVEPLPGLFERLIAARPRDANVQAAISNQSGVLQLQEVLGAHGLSTATPELANAHRKDGRTVITREAKCLTLRALCEQHCAETPIDFMKIDVEGHEAQVLGSGDFKRFRPRVLVVESGWHPEAWHELVLGFDYLLALDDSLNRYYVRSEDASLLERLKFPANVNDRYVRADHAQLMRLGREWDAFGPVLQSVTRRLRQMKDASPELKRRAKALLRAANLLNGDEP